MNVRPVLEIKNMPSTIARSHLLPLASTLCVLACSSGSSPGGPDTSTSDTTSTSEAGPFSPTEPTSTGSAAESSTGTTADPTTTSSGTSESTGVVAVCGDGAVDAGEECDQGENNADDGACTLDCKPAVCGDGLVQAGVEECDDAVDNGTHYGGCSDACAFNPRCGDGMLDLPNEDCDYADGNGTGEGQGLQGPCSDGCKWEGRMVFLTSLLYDGNFVSLHDGDDLTGLQAADRECQTRAFYAGLQNWETYRAWLSDDKLGPLDRFDSLPVRPFLLPNGEVIAVGLSDLIIHGPGEGIRVDEYGSPLPTSKVWTNTAKNGEPYSEDDHCDGWTTASSDSTARIGNSHMSHDPEDAWKQWQEEKQWTSKQGRACSELARLYCFEQ